MRLGKVLEKTGLSKRTVYFYIQEKFLTPKMNPENGYYDFSEEDIDRLIFLNQLRKADFSIKDIHMLLRYPVSAFIYVQKKIDELAKEKELLSRKIDSLQDLRERLPIVTSDESLSSTVIQTEFPDAQSVECPLPERSARLVSCYLWGPFVYNINMTEYRQFLWNRILAETEKVSKETLKKLKDYLYSLTAEQLDSEFNKRTEHIEQVIALKPDEIENFVLKVVTRIEKILHNPVFIKEWKEKYNSHISAITRLYDAEFNKIVSELTPRFQMYYKNIHACCSRIYEILQSDAGKKLKDKILVCLDGYIDFEACHHGEIAAFFGDGRI